MRAHWSSRSMSRFMLQAFVTSHAESCKFYEKLSMSIRESGGLTQSGRLARDSYTPHSRGLALFAVRPPPEILNVNRP